MRICCDIICISLQSWINFLPGPPSFDDGRVAPFKSSALYANDSQWGLGLGQCVDSVVFNPCVKSMSHAPWTILHNLSPINPGIGILEYIHAITVGKKVHLWKRLDIPFIQVVSWPHFLTRDFQLLWKCGSNDLGFASGRRHESLREFKRI